MPEPAAVCVSDLRFRWPGGTWTLAVSDLVIEAGERVFLHGPSGSGKSTLLSLIGGVLSPDSGDIRLGGEAFSSVSASRRDRLRADRIGMIFQLFNLLPYLSLVDNVLLPLRFSKARLGRVSGDPRAEALRLLEHLDLGPDLHHKPVRALSIGQQQRVAAARALIGRPGLVIADEPTSALDADRQQAFLDLLMAECAQAGAALLFVSHDLRIAGHFDRVLNLDDLAA